jgi:GDPmannose 4,6-dehydratase
MKKILQEAIEIKNGKREVLEVGNLEIRRDFGYAPKFVEAMYLMMQKISRIIILFVQAVLFR